MGGTGLAISACQKSSIFVALLTGRCVFRFVRRSVVLQAGGGSGRGGDMIVVSSCSSCHGRGWLERIHMPSIYPSTLATITGILWPPPSSLLLLPSTPFQHVLLPSHPPCMCVCLFTKANVIVLLYRFDNQGTLAPRWSQSFYHSTTAGTDHIPRDKVRHHPCIHPTTALKSPNFGEERIATQN